MDWFDDDAYRHFDTLDAAGLAWECLRRNAQYRQEYPLMVRGTASAAVWGLRFPGRSGAACAGGARDLGPEDCACRDIADGAASGGGDGCALAARAHGRGTERGR